MLGTSAGLCAREQLRRGASAWRSAYAAGVIAHALLVLTPMSLILAWTYPEWANPFPGQDAGSGLIWLAVAPGSAVLGLAGFCSQALLKRQAAGLACLPLLLSAAALVLALVFFPGGLSLGDPNEPWAGPLRVTLVFSLPVMLAGWSFLLAVYGLEGRKMRFLHAQSQQPQTDEPVGLAATRAKP